MEYDPTATYEFTDAEGNVISSLGDNGYIWQAYTEGLPLSINDKGEWFVTPYLDTSGGQIVSYIPEWFKSTPDYASWEALEGQLSTATPLQIAAAQDYLKAVGSMGAYKYSQTNYAKQFGITDEQALNDYADYVYAMALEGNGDEKASFNFFGSEQSESVEDILRDFKNMSKEELSQTITNLYQIVKKGADGTWTGDQKTLSDALAMVTLVEYTKDNLGKYGEEGEFDGLYDASFLQNFRRWFAVMSASFTENNVLGIPVRLLNWAVNGTPKIEDRINTVLGTDPTLGASLEGTTTAEKIGIWSGAAVNIAVTLYLMKGAGKFINGHFADSSIGNFLATGGNTITGAVAADFFVNDLPLDIVMFINDLGRYEGDVGKALWNPEETQPLTGIPFVTTDDDGWLMPSGLGPQVPGGFIMNAAGDILVDFAPKILQVASNAASSRLDGLTNGGVTRLRATASNKLIGVEDKLANSKVLSWWWQKFTNKMMGPEYANLVRESRKAAVASKSNDIYIEMQNALTFNNQKGMSEVGPKFKAIEDELGLPKTIEDFINRANELGGIKYVDAKIRNAIGGQEAIDYKHVDDVLPIYVKQGVLDVEHLAWVKGQVDNAGGIVQDVRTKNEIAELEERLSKTPQEIKDFADKVAEANKRVEDIRIEAGITNEQWIKQLRESPEFAKYMTRQTVNPEYGGIGGASNPAEANIFGTRSGYYAKNYIDPILALNLKVEAIGKAIAWNNTQKVLSAAESIQGNITAGGDSIKVASHLADLKEEIRTKADYRQRIGWDDSLKNFNYDMNSVSNSFRYINDLQNMPGNASVKAVYNSFVDPNIKNTLRDFSTGKITFAEGVKEAVGLSDSAAAQVINNTYRLEGTPSTAEKAGSVPFDKAITEHRLVGEDIVGKGADDVDARIQEIIGVKRDLSKLRNTDGEIDVGIYGLTEKARERTTKTLTDAADKIKQDIDAQRTALYEKFANSNKNELDWDYNKNLWVNQEYVKRNLDGDKVTKEALAEEYTAKHPKPEKYTQEQLFKELDDIEKGLDDIYDTNVTSLTWGLDSRALVDSDATMPFSDVFGKSEDYFQQLTRGEVRRSLYEGGYENSKFKSDIDKADNAFTQRAKENFVGYRSETSGTDRTIKVGEPLDTSAWMYGAVTPGYTDTYRAGLTGGKKSGLSDGIMYRLHIKEGTPIYMPTAKGDLKLTPSNGAQYIKQKAHRYEFVLPRDIRAIPTAISKERVGLNPFKKMTIVDVEVDANSGYAPKLNMTGEDILGRGGASKSGTVSDNVPTENVPLTSASGYNAGITNDGVPYKYQMMNGKIITMEKITDANELADAVASMGGVYRIAPETINHLGEDFTHGILRGIKYYNEEMIPLPTGATFRVANHDGVYGWIPTPGRSVNQGQYRFRIKDGFFVADQYPLYLEANLYRKGGEARLSSYQARDAASGFAPKNSNVPENTAIHENGHNMMARLTILELNDEIKNGILKVPENVTQEWINQTIYEKWVNLHQLIGSEALKSMGYAPTDAEWMRQAKTISGYAGKGNYENKTYRYETMSEGEVDFYCNKQNASAFTLAVLDQMKKHASRFAMSAEPGIVMAKNELTPPKGMIKDDQYNFPSNVKTNKQKAKWLESYRKNNPYVGGKKFTEDTYIKANLWDTFLQKEIYSYNPDSKTTMPDALVKKNGTFLEELDVKAGDLIMNKIKEAGVKGFQQELATVVLSKNSEDISKAIDNFIIARVNEAAQEVAAKLPGGATEDNLNKARATMWSEDAIRNDVANMVRTLTPDVDMKTIQSSVAELFKRQSEGFAAYDALPVDIKDKIYEMKQLEAQLARNNAYVKDAGRKADAELQKENWSKDATRVVHYKEGGQDVYLLVKDPLIASLYEKPNDFKNTGLTTEGITAFANAVSRAYRLGTTAMNPIALVSNVLRDPLQATIQGGFNPLTMNFSLDVFYRNLRQFGLDDVTIEKVIQKGVNWTKEGTMTAELRRYGTGIGYKNNVERAGQAVNRVFNNEARSKTGKVFGKIIETGEAPLEMWESYFRNQVYQQSFEKNYKRTKDVNKAMSAAMFDASNSTTNFSHAIGHYQNAISTVPYLSSAINGTRSFWVQFNVDPIGMMGRITAGAMVPTMAITAWNLGSEERRKTYLNLPEWYRQQHLVFVDMNNNVFALPIPGELEQYYGTARKLIEFTQESSPYALGTILAHGAFGFLPMDINGFFGEDGSINFQEGAWQLASGIMPQAVTALYEFRYERNLFTGQDLSDYTTFNKWLNLLGNVMGTGFKEAINSIGLMAGVPEKELVGKGFANTLARNLFGVGFDDATAQFMNLIGEGTHRAESGKMVQATGLYKKNEDLRVDLKKISQDIAFAKDENERKELEEKKQKMIDDFSNEVKNLVNNYMQLYTITGGLKEWQKKKIVQILTLGGGYSSANSESYVADEANQASLSEQNLARERYMNAGLPAGPNDFTTSIEAQAALNRFYGAPKQAASDFTHIADEAELKDIRDAFYDAVDKIYDYAEERNISPDYDMIERIQARYLQAVDAVLIPVINEYGIDVLNNSKFIDTVEKYVNGMIPSDDWKQSTKNARKYLSTKEFPTATVNVKKWLIQRYSTGMRNRGLKSDDEVIRMLAEIKADIDTGKAGSAQGKIQNLIDGINRANYYISSDDFQLLTQFKNMVK